MVNPPLGPFLQAKRQTQHTNTTLSATWNITRASCEITRTSYKITRFLQSQPVTRSGRDMGGLPLPRLTWFSWCWQKMGWIFLSSLPLPRLTGGFGLRSSLICILAINLVFKDCWAYLAQNHSWYPSLLSHYCHSCPSAGSWNCLNQTKLWISL